MNAQVGLSNLGQHVDVMHFNLHKTFSTPHGGGGPGSGPISIKKHLIPFTPNVNSDDKMGKSIGSVASTNYGSTALLPIAWG